MFSGKSLSENIEKDDHGKVNNNTTYIVTSIESAASSKLPIPSYKDYIENDMIIPFVRDINQSALNIYTIGGGYSKIVEKWRIVSST